MNELNTINWSEYLIEKNFRNLNYQESPHAFNIPYQAGILSYYRDEKFILSHHLHVLNQSCNTYKDFYIMTHMHSAF